MRYECKRADVATKWFEITLMPLSGDDFAVVESYGTKNAGSNEDTVLQAAKGIFAGNYLTALDVVNKKIQDRLSIGYVRIEPKQTE